ncbi:MAG: FtsX-like permease family protein [Hydrogenophaga sp.]|uniref:FtsX-like permease family protein n=1 Tax=Hydrogenophaga sp. TaxID=1904254 RepID=UPI001DB466E5|nr:FtsX-like permease family protein [Hydrogenophaga sp.]MBX3611009.1 FtsX-like permease family protein [Hydrogenophaga sp.]
MIRLLATFSWQELRHHPWRSAVAVLAVTLGVALALAVQLINRSALAEFGNAVAAVNGQPDAELRARLGGLDDALWAQALAQPGVAVASPVLEASATFDGDPALALRLVGVDALSVAQVAPALMPVLDPALDAGRLDLFAPDAVFLNAAAREALASRGATGNRLSLRIGSHQPTLRIAGQVTAPGAPLAVMDVAALQALSGRSGELSRIDLRLAPGASLDAVVAGLKLPPEVLVQRPGQGEERVSNLSRAYRVNLTVLALVALFTGAFLVFSVLSLSVTRRQQQLALLGVIGLSARERLRLVLAESALIGAVGSVLGVALGTALSALALQRLGGDLGGGYFTGVAPSLRFSWPLALAYGALGVGSAVVGGWWPARAAAALAPAQALKGMGTPPAGPRRHWLALGLVVAAGGMALAPPVAGVPVAAYVSVGLLLVGGIAALPLAVGAALDHIAPRLHQRLLPMLAVERARRLRETAAVATSGVVASLALSVALTVMVASFRDSVSRWLDAVLPAPLYLRSAGDGAALPPGFVAAVRQLPGVARVDTLRAQPLQIDPVRPPVALLVRSLNADPLPLALVGERVAVPDGAVPVYVSEAMRDLYGARLGQALLVLAQALGMPADTPTRFVVAGVWRDYARQHGSIAIDAAAYARLTGDTRVSDLALHLTEGVTPEAAGEALRTLAERQGLGGAVELATVGEIRARSLRIFDRSFAVTVWLQAVAIAIGLFGVAASFSAQVLVRRREFGLLAHLGLTRAQVLGVVALEGLAWTVIGALAGLGLGLLVSLVLVQVVNPQSFHWTMDLVLPWPRLLALCVAVVAAGTLTAWLSGRAAASADAVQAVKQDW